MTRRGAIARLLVAALSLQLALPLLAGTSGPHARAAATSHQIVLCTPAGLKFVRVDEDGHRLPDQEPTKGVCPICLAVAAALASPAPSWLVPAPAPGRTPLPRFQVAVTAVPSPAYGVPPVRAPPRV